MLSAKSLTRKTNHDLPMCQLKSTIYSLWNEYRVFVFPEKCSINEKLPSSFAVTATICKVAWNCRLYQKLPKTDTFLENTSPKVLKV